MSSDKVQILVVDDDISHCTILQALLRGWGYQVGLAHNGLQALEQIHQQVFDLVLCDIRMAEMDGIATLKEIKAYNPAIPVLIMTAFSSVGTAVEAIKSGALDYLVKPLDFDTLQQTLVQALAHTRQSESDPSVATDSRWGMIGDSPAMQALLNDITLVAPSDATVLIYGWAICFSRAICSRIALSWACASLSACFTALSIIAWASARALRSCASYSACSCAAASLAWAAASRSDSILLRRSSKTFSSGLYANFAKIATKIKKLIIWNNNVPSVKLTNVTPSFHDGIQFLHH